MKMKQLLALVAFALALAVSAAPPPVAAVNPCAPFCAIASCEPGQVCGQFVNPSGQTVCGCHDPRPKG